MVLTICMVGITNKNFTGLSQLLSMGNKMMCEKLTIPKIQDCSKVRPILHINSCTQGKQKSIMLFKETGHVSLYLCNIHYCHNDHAFKQKSVFMFVWVVFFFLFIGEEG